MILAILLDRLFDLLMVAGVGGLISGTILGVVGRCMRLGMMTDPGYLQHLDAERKERQKLLDE